MKGYLQRITENVIDPGKSVQPALRPIFSARTFGENAASFVSEETASSASPVSPLVRQTVQDRFALTQQLDSSPAPVREIPPSDLGNLDREASASDSVLFESAKPGNLSSNSDPTSAKAEMRPIEPVVSRQQTKEKQGGPRYVRPMSDVTNRGSSDAPQHVKTRPDSVSTEPELKSNHLIRTTPLVPLNSRRDDTQHIVPSTRNQLPPNDISPNKQNRGLLGRTETESDDIHIHIGRIEVVALPPAPPRPSTRSIPKPLDLDEYLKRSDRRAL